MLHRPLYRRKAGYSFIRSLNPAAWFRADTGVTVTGLGASTWADQSGNGRDLLQTTDASRPPYLSYSGTKYLYLPGAAGNTASTPDSAAISITTSLIVAAETDIWTGGTWRAIDKNNLEYGLVVGLTQDVSFYWTDSGGTLRNLTSASKVPFATGTAGQVRADFNPTTGAVAFYYRASGTSLSDLSGWTAMSNPAAFGATSIRDNAGELSLGVAAGVFPTGKLYRACIFNGTTLVADFNPNLDGSDQAATITSSATGEVWTINKSGGLPAQIVASPRLLGDGTADAMATANFTLNQPCSGLMVVNAISWTAGDYLCSGTVAEGGMTQVTATPQVGLNAGSAAAANTGITLGSWKVVYYELNGASSKLKVGSAAATTGNAGANNPGGLTLFRNQGATAFANGMLREWIVFPSALDDAAIARVMSYASGRWGVAL